MQTYESLSCLLNVLDLDFSIIVKADQDFIELLCPDEGEDHELWENVAEQLNNSLGSV